MPTISQTERLQTSFAVITVAMTIIIITLGTQASGNL